MFVMFKSLCRIRGTSSTPTLMDFAVRNGDLLNFGSSAIDRLSAASEPVKSDRLRLPTSTFRPSAAEAFSSIVGRNWLTGIRNGATSTRITRTTMTTSRTRSVRRMSNLRIGGDEKRNASASRRRREEDNHIEQTL